MAPTHGRVRRSGPLRYATARRFGLPEPVDPADPQPTDGQVGPQLPSRLEPVTGPAPGRNPQGEDCLALSVAAPGTPGPHPVMVFLHGGGFMTGAGLFPWYDGGVLAAEGDVVVVSVNYRLGPLGWLHREGVAPGNLGLHDAVAALRWVHAAIGRWGGDPDRITVFGQSAGGMLIQCLLELPDVRRLFRRAIVQSAPDVRDLALAPEEADALGRAALAHLDGDDPRTVPAGRLLEATARAGREEAERSGPRLLPLLAPVRDHPPLGPARVLPEDPGSLDLLVGWNRDELSAFGSVVGGETAVRSEDLFGRPWVARAAELVAAGARVTGYRADWRPEGSPFGATHCVELPLLLGDRDAWSAAPMLGTTPWAEVDRLGRQLRGVWSTFVHTGRVDTALAPDVPVRWDPAGTLTPLLHN